MAAQAYDMIQDGTQDFYNQQAELARQYRLQRPPTTMSVTENIAANAQPQFTMTDRTHPEAGSIHIIRYALELGLLWIDGDGRDKVREALDALDTLEAQLKALKPNGEAQQLTPLQAQVAAHYQGGEFGYIETQDDAQNVGDGLFTFCINEAGDAGDKSELVNMLNRAIEQLRSLVGELEAQLEAIGAGGVSGPLVGRAALSAKAGWTNADADAARLALELECLLMDTKDTAVVSKWWQSANEALELHRARLQEAQPSPRHREARYEQL